MALKDWKKTGGLDIYELYRMRHIKKRDDLILFQNPANDKFDILLENDLCERLLYAFETKKQAIKFIEDYMRKH